MTADESNQLEKLLDRKLDEKLAPIDKRLANVEKTMATQEDLKQFATKQDLQATEERFTGELKATEQRFKNELWEVEQKFEEKVESSFRRYRDDVLRGLDQVMGELQTTREEQTILNGQYADLRGRVEKLEEQVAQLISQQAR